MHASVTLGFKGLALATVASMALAGAAMAQKSGPAPAPQQALPTVKPPPLGAPMQAQPPMAPPPQAQMPPAQPPQIQPIPRAFPRTPTTPAPQAQAPQAIPANEPAAVTRLRGLLGRNVRLSYGNAEALDAAGERVRMTDVVLEQPGKRLAAAEVLISGLRQDGVGEAVIRGVETRDGGVQVRIGTIRLNGLTVPRDPSGAPPQPDQVRVDQLRIEGVEATVDTPLRMRVFAVENWVAGQPARVNLEGFELDRMDAGIADAMRLARLAVTGVDFGTTLAALMRQETPPSLVGRASLELDGLTLTGGGRPVGGLQEARIAADVTRADGSGTGTLAFRGIRVEPVPMIAEWLTRFGYQAIDAEITADTAYDASTGRIEMRDLSVMGREVGTLSFALTMDGMTRERAQAGDVSQLRLIAMGLRYADASLFRRFIGMQAAQTRTPEPQLREQFAQMAGGALTQPGAAALDPIRDAVQRFIRGQAQTVEIRVNPPQPLSMEQLQGVPPSPAEAQRMLGITASAR